MSKRSLFPASILLYNKDPIHHFAFLLVVKKMLMVVVNLFLSAVYVKLGVAMYYSFKVTRCDRSICKHTLSVSHF